MGVGVGLGKGRGSVCLSEAFWITFKHLDGVKQENKANQTLVDWLAVSGGFHFDPDSRKGLKKRGGEAGR